MTDIDILLKIIGKLVVWGALIGYIIVTIIRNHLWKKESILCIALWVFLSIDDVWRILWFSLDSSDRHHILVISDLPFEIIICLSVLVVIVAMFYYQWNVLGKFKGSIPQNRRLVIKRILFLIVNGIILFHCIIYVSYLLKL